MRGGNGKRQRRIGGKVEAEKGGGKRVIVGGGRAGCDADASCCDHLIRLLNFAMGIHLKAVFTHALMSC